MHRHRLVRPTDSGTPAAPTPTRHSLGCPRYAPPANAPSSSRRPRPGPSSNQPPNRTWRPWGACRTTPLPTQPDPKPPTSASPLIHSPVLSHSSPLPHLTSLPSALSPSSTHSSPFAPRPFFRAARAGRDVDSPYSGLRADNGSQRLVFGPVAVAGSAAHGSRNQGQILRRHRSAAGGD